MFSNMLLARHIGSLGLIDSIKAFFAMLGGFFGNLINFLCTLIYYLFMGVATIISYAELAFKELAGIDALSVNGTEYGGASSEGYDLVIAFITDETVQDVFWSIMALSLVLLFVFTIVAIIKSEFTLDLKGSAKGPIISRALKSLVNFLVVPVVTIISVIATNFLTKTIYDLFETEGTTIVNECFYVGAYNANRARNDSKFADYLTTSYWFQSGTNPFSGTSGQDAIANKVDDLFHDFEETNITFEVYDHKDRWAIDNNKNIDSNYSDWFMEGMAYPKPNSLFSLWNINMVRYFYDISAIDYVLAFGSAVVIAWIMLSVSLVLVKRAFELVILYLLAPPMIAIAPLDGGQAEKRWRGEFMKRLLSVIAPIFAFNMYFIMIPLFKNIELLPPPDTTTFITSSIASNGVMLGTYRTAINGFLNIFNVFFQLVCIITGLSVLKSASALLSSLLGVEDLVKSGGDAAKKAVATGAKAFNMAAGITGTAIKGVAASARAVGGAVKASGIGDKIAGSKLGQKVKARKDQLAEGFNNSALGKKLAERKEEKKNARKELASADEKFGDAKAAYDENESAIKELTGKKDLSAEEQRDLADRLAKRSELGDNLDNAHSARTEARARVARTKILKNSNDRIAILRSGVDKYGVSKSDRQKSLDAHKVSRIKTGQRVRQSLIDAYNSEFGEHADETGAAAKASKYLNAKADKYLKHVPFLNKIPNITGSIEQMLAIGGDTQKRRLNDAIVGLAADTGADTLWKYWFNPNPRGDLFMGVPEKKKRDAQVDTDINFAARDKFAEKKDAKAAQQREEEYLQKYLAKKMGKDAEYQSLLKSLETANKAGDSQSIKVAKLQVEKFESDNNLKQRASVAYRDGTMKTPEFKKYREMLQSKAKADAADSEVKDSLEAQAAKAAALARAGQEDKEQNVKFSEGTISELMRRLSETIKDSKNKSNSADVNALNAIKESITAGNDSIQSALTELAKALEGLGKDDKK